jgi:hypothetical protein
MERPWARPRHLALSTCVGPQHQLYAYSFMSSWGSDVVTAMKAKAGSLAGDWMSLVGLRSRIAFGGMWLAREPGAGSGERGAGKKRARSRDCRKKSRNR